MTRRWVPRAATAGVLVTLTSCGAVQPIGSDTPFHRDVADSRVYAAYRQTGRHVVVQVRLPAKVEHARVRMDCIGRGWVRVALLRGVVERPCRAESASSGFIGLTRAPVMTRETSARIDITVTRGSTWSVAVDVGDGTIDPALDQ